MEYPQMKIGSKVRMSPMWKYEEATGVIVKMTKAYTIIKWDNVPGQWHYTPEQAQKIELL
jgi:hypothetical protein